MNRTGADEPVPTEWAEAELLGLVLTMHPASFDMVYREGALPTWLGAPADRVGVVDHATDGRGGLINDIAARPWRIRAGRAWKDRSELSLSVGCGH